MAFKYTEDQLNKMDKTLLIELFLGLQDQMEDLTKETHALNEKMQLMMEQLVLGKQQRFGRFTERMEDTEQICFMEERSYSLTRQKLSVIRRSKNLRNWNFRKYPEEKKEKRIRIFPGSRSEGSIII